MKQSSRILIVDDEQVVRLSHLRSLGQAGYQSEAVRNGREALARLEQRVFDVVFLDLRMPDLDGIAVLSAIKSRWPECEVIIITGYPEVSTAKAAVRLGAWDYLVKPLGPDDIVRAATAALTHKGWALHIERLAQPGFENPVCRRRLSAEFSPSVRQGDMS